MIAVIKTGGKQYKVSEKDTLKIERLKNVEAGQEYTFDEVLLVGNEDGKDVTLGAPFIEGAVVKVKILREGKAKKIDVIKYKAKTRYRRKIGHRQIFTEIEVQEIRVK